MLKYLLFPLLFVFQFQNFAFGQKKFINRSVAQKNYEGYMLLQEEKYDSALLLFNDAIKDDPEAFFIYQNRAVCHLFLHDTLKAINDYKTNIRLEPGNAESIYALGNIYKTRKDTLNAKYLFLSSIEHADIAFSQVKKVYMNNFLGHVFYAEHKYDSALVFYNNVKVYKPEDANIFINAATCNFRLNNLEAFCTDIEKAYVLGGDVSCYVLRAFCKGCSHLFEESGRKDTLLNTLDSRLLMTTQIPPVNDVTLYNSITDFEFDSKKVKVYFNNNWEICAPKKGVYYREAFWAKLLNFFGGNFTDYYADGNIYAEGRIESRNTDGNYKSYYRNGNLKAKGHFKQGLPNSKWEYFLENGKPDFNINFFFETFSLEFLNESNPAYQLTDGTGKFEIVLDDWNGLKTKISGEYLNNGKTGEWSYIRGDEILIQEKFKKGKFVKGYALTQIGKLNLVSSAMDASIFIPPYIDQMSLLYIDSLETIQHYPFIKVGL